MHATDPSPFPASEPAVGMPAAAAAVEVIAFHLGSDRDIALAEAEGLLDDAERERAASFRFDRHRERFVRGRGMLRTQLGQRLGRDPRGLVFEYGPRGKPRLADDGAGEGAALRFNLSHSEDLAAMAIGPVPDLGIDLERLDRRPDFVGLGRRCFRPAELARVEQASGAERAEAFFWTWTAKEARMKATGEGFALSPLLIELAFERGLPSRYLEPAAPPAFLAPLRLFGDQAVAVVAAMGPFEIATRDAAG
jgi:phosphopantetheinyl transferase